MAHSKNEIGKDDKRMESSEFDAKLRKLAVRWKSHGDADLTLRRDAGDLLNRRLGVPGASRLARGELAVKQVMAELGISASEVSRLRWFAHRFESIEDLKAKHPEAMSWRKVKALLPKMKGAKKKAGAGRPSSPEALKRALGALTLILKKGPSKAIDDEKEEIMAKLRELGQEVAKCLHVVVSFAQEENSSDETQRELASVA